MKAIGLFIWKKKEERSHRNLNGTTRDKKNVDVRLYFPFKMGKEKTSCLCKETNTSSNGERKRSVVALGLTAMPWGQCLRVKKREVREDGFNCTM